MMRGDAELDPTTHSASALARGARSRGAAMPPGGRSGRATEAPAGRAGGSRRHGLPEEPLDGCPVAAATWRRLAKATVARRLVTLLVLVVLPVGSQSVLDAALAPPGLTEPGWQVVLRVGIGAAAVAGTVGLVLLSLSRDLRRRHLIAEHDGRVHPRTLEVLPAGTRIAADARTYWWTWLVTAEPPAVFAARTAASSVIEAPGRSATVTSSPGAGTSPSSPSPSSSATRTAPTGERPATGTAAALLAQRRELAVPAVLLLVVPWVVALLAGRSPISAAIIPVIAFIAFGVVRCLPWLTVAAELPLRRCHECDQPLTSSNRCCPECGTAIRPGHLRAARPRTARRAAEAVVVAIAACWLLGVLAAEPIARAIRSSAAMPSAALLADLAGAPAWDAAAFRTLVARGPDADIADRLAEILNQRRRANARVGPEAWTWFDAAVAQGRIDREHELVRWRDSVELLRVVPVELGEDVARGWGGVAVDNAPPATREATEATRTRLAVRFVRRFDAADGRRVGLIVVGVRVGDRPVITPRSDDGRLCLVSAGERPSQATWLPDAERLERPWPAPPEYVIPLPPLPREMIAAVRDGEPVTLEVIRYVAAPGMNHVGVAWTPWGHRITGPVDWQSPERIVLPAGRTNTTRSADARLAGVQP